MNSLDRNLLNSDRCETLTMATRPAVLLLPLLLENDDLVRAIGLENRRFDLRIGTWLARFHFATIFDHHNIAELNPGARFTRELFQAHGLTRLHPVLFAARLNHGVHG